MNQSKMKLGHVIYKVANLDRAVDEYRKKGFIVEYGKNKNLQCGDLLCHKDQTNRSPEQNITNHNSLSRFHGNTLLVGPTQCRCSTAEKSRSPQRRQKNQER